MLLDSGAVTITADVRDLQYNPAADAKVEAHILGPSGVNALLDMTPVPDSPGQFQAAWSAPRTGAYLTEVTAQRTDPATGTVKELGRDVLTFQRMDGVAENFHTEQNRDLLERLRRANRRTILEARRLLGKLPAAIPFPMPASPCARPRTCGICRWFSWCCRSCCAFPNEWLRRRVGDRLNHGFCASMYVRSTALMRVW